MPHRYLFALLLLAPLTARAELLVSKRESSMCSSASALAKLALPAGGSRAIGDATPLIGKIAQDGDCGTFRQGQVVIVEKARVHTSIVRMNSNTGDGLMVRALVANIDFDPYTPPHTTFFDTVRAHCPDLLDVSAAVPFLVTPFVGSLPPALHASISKVVEDGCDAGMYCVDNTLNNEVTKRHLTERFAMFLCSHPKIAAGVYDKTTKPIGD